MLKQKFELVKSFTLAVKGHGSKKPADELSATPATKDTSRNPGGRHTVEQG
jgi:hypothetical protein